MADRPEGVRTWFSISPKAAYQKLVTTARLTSARSSLPLASVERNREMRRNPRTFVLVPGARRSPMCASGLSADLITSLVNLVEEQGQHFSLPIRSRSVRDSK